MGFVALVDHVLKKVESLVVLARFAGPVQDFHEMGVFELEVLRQFGHCFSGNSDNCEVPTLGGGATFIEKRDSA